MNKFEEFMVLSEFLDKVRNEVDDRFYINLPDKVIIHVLKQYEEFKKELPDGKR